MVVKGGVMLSSSAYSTTDWLRFLPSNLSIHNENPNPNFFQKATLLPPKCTRPPHLRLLCRRINSHDVVAETSQPDAGIEEIVSDGVESGHTSMGIGNPSLFRTFAISRMSSGDQAFFLLAFLACTTAVSFASLVIAAVPTLFAMKRAAISLARLADTAQEEIPSTMAAIRLSGMEISGLTLELNELSEEIASGVSKSAKAVQAAEAGIRQIGALARQQTISMIQERANLPEISLSPVIAGAARKTSDVVGQATKKFVKFFSQREQKGKRE